MDEDKTNDQPGKEGKEENVSDSIEEKFSAFFIDEVIYVGSVEIDIAGKIIGRKSVKLLDLEGKALLMVNICLFYGSDGQTSCFGNLQFTGSFCTVKNLFVP